MRGGRLFRTNVSRMPSGKFRWSVCVSATQASVASGVARSQSDARMQARLSQETLSKQYGSSLRYILH